MCEISVKLYLINFRERKKSKVLQRGIIVNIYYKKRSRLVIMRDFQDIFSISRPFSCLDYKAFAFCNTNQGLFNKFQKTQLFVKNFTFFPSRLKFLGIEIIRVKNKTLFCSWSQKGENSVCWKVGKKHVKYPIYDIIGMQNS